MNICESSRPLVECIDVCGTYKNREGSIIHAVNSVNLRICRTETFGLVGESGSGKSTLGYMILNLKKTDSGSILFDGRPVTGCTGKQEKELRRCMQIIFQDPYLSLDPKMHIGSQIQESLDIFHPEMSREQKKETVDHMLNSVGLDIRLRHSLPSELSGGQRQRVAIAQALIIHPSFVVCDEPVSSLDVSIQAQILNLLQKLKEEDGLTYLFISHNLNVIAYTADRIGVMYLGTIVETGPSEDVSSHPLHPYTQGLFDLSGMVSDKNRKHVVIQGEIPDPAFPPSGCPFHTRCPFCTDRCINEKPELQTAGDGRMCACHFVPKS